MAKVKWNYIIQLADDNATGVEEKHEILQCFICNVFTKQSLTWLNTIYSQSAYLQLITEILQFSKTNFFSIDESSLKQTR